MNPPFSDLWVGAYIKTGALILYDPKLQIAGHEWVNLYSVNKDGIRPFERTVVRNKIRCASHTEHEYALRAYEAWAQKDDGSFVAAELLDKEQEEKRRSSDLLLNDQQNQINQHREFLSKIGKSGEAKIVESRRNRATNCYSCKCDLSSTANLECTSCNWLICKCGACGCGYSKY